MGRGPSLSPQIRSRICQLRALRFSYKRIHELHPEVPYSTIRYTCLREERRADNKSPPLPEVPHKLSGEHADVVDDTVQHQSRRITIQELLDSVDTAVEEMVPPKPPPEAGHAQAASNATGPS